MSEALPTLHWQQRLGLRVLAGTLAMIVRQLRELDPATTAAMRPPVTVRQVENWHARVLATVAGTADAPTPAAAPTLPAPAQAPPPA